MNIQRHQIQSVLNEEVVAEVAEHVARGVAAETLLWAQTSDGWVLFDAVAEKKVLVLFTDGRLFDHEISDAFADECYAAAAARKAAVKAARRAERSA